MSDVSKGLILGKNEDSFSEDEEEGFLKKGFKQGPWCIADEKPLTMKQILEDDISPTVDEFDYLDDLDAKICTENYSMSIGKSFSFSGPQNMNR